MNIAFGRLAWRWVAAQALVGVSALAAAAQGPSTSSALGKAGSALAGAKTLLDFFSPMTKDLTAALKDTPWFAAIVLIVIIVAASVSHVNVIREVKDSKKRRFSEIGGLIFVASFAILAVAYIGAYRPSRRQSEAGPAAGLSDSQRRRIIRYLFGAKDEAASALKVQPELARANLFMVMPTDKGRLQIVPGLVANMNRPEELSLTMPIGYGSTGLAYETKKPNIAIFADGWQNSVTLAPAEQKKVAPNLRWIISVPVVGEEKSLLAILNVDGLDEPRDEASLKQALDHLYTWSAQIADVIELGRDQERLRIDDSLAAASPAAPARAAAANPYVSQVAINKISRKDIAPASTRFLAVRKEAAAGGSAITFDVRGFNEEVKKRFASSERAVVADRPPHSMGSPSRRDEQPTAESPSF